MSSSPTPTSIQRPPPTLRDRLGLWLLKLAKLRRRAFTAPEGQAYEDFYEAFFDEKDLELYDQDCRLAVRQQTILHTLAQEFGDPSPSVIDVGCGLGEVLAA